MHRGPGVQTAVGVASTRVAGLGLACGILLYGPELRTMFVFLKGLTTTKTQQRTTCGLSPRRRHVALGRKCLQTAASHRQLQGQGHPLPQEHLNFGKGLLMPFSRFFPLQYFSLTSSKFILISLYLALESFQFSIN